MYVCMYVCMYMCMYTHMYVCMYPRNFTAGHFMYMYVCMYMCMYVHTFARFNLTFVKKQVVTLVSAFRRDARPPKPPECLDDDGVGFQETLAEDVCFSHCGATKRRYLLAPYTNLQRLVLLHSVIKHLKLCSVRCICTHPLVPLPHHTQTTICSSCKHNDSCGYVADCKWWEGPHRYLEQQAVKCHERCVCMSECMYVFM